MEFNFQLRLKFHLLFQKYFILKIISVLFQKILLKIRLYYQILFQVKNNISYS